MASIQFDVGDDYDKKCGEMFLTLKGNIVFHCTLCEDKYEVFEQYADHILLHYIGSSNIKQAITDEVQPAQLNDDNRVLVPKWRKNKPPPISELMRKLFEHDENSVPNEVISIKEEVIDETIPEPMVIASQSDDNSDNVEAFDIKVEFSETGFSDNEPIEDMTANQTNIEKFNCFYKCLQCSTAFATPKNLQEHITEEHRRSNINISNKNLKANNEHSEKLSSETHEVFVCKCCGKGYPTSSELQDHIEYYINENNKTCSFCETVFQNTAALHRHMGIHYHERHYECDICKARFKREKGLFEHKRMHENQERTFACKICNEKFQLKVGLKWHVRTKHTKNTNKSNGSLEYMEVDLGSHVDAMTSAALL